jgi:hypothetical protein
VVALHELTLEEQVPLPERERLAKRIGDALRSGTMG